MTSEWACSACKHAVHEPDVCVYCWPVCIHGSGGETDIRRYAEAYATMRRYAEAHPSPGRLHAYTTDGRINDVFLSRAREWAKAPKHVGGYGR